jgi:hypothetical protein
MIQPNISKHFSYNEAVQTSTGIENIPNDLQLLNIKLLADNIFEKLREEKGSGIKINSVFRCEELNTRIGGSRNSQHLAINGAAMDIKITRELFEWMIDNLDFDQLIYEFGTDDCPQWVHVSYKIENNRNQVLRSIKKGGTTLYNYF